MLTALTISIKFYNRILHHGNMFVFSNETWNFSMNNVWFDEK